MDRGPTVGTIVSAYAFQISVAIALWLLVVNARREGHRWLWTLVWGILFGYAIEYINVHDAEPLYYYPDCAGAGLCPGHTICLTSVAAWVPIGWGEVLYLSTWTAQRLRIKSWAKPIAAAFLAVSFDLTLDPVAQATHLWCWKHFEVNFFDVPFDNFLAWFLVVYIYAFCARWLLHKVTPKGDSLRSPGIDFAMAGLAALAALAAFEVVKFASQKLPSYHTDDGTMAGLMFIVVSVLASAFTWFHTLGSRRDRAVNWATLAIPAYFHLVALVLVVATGAWKQHPAMVIAIPFNLMVGFIIHAWASLELLFRSPGRGAGLDAAPSRPQPWSPDAEHEERSSDAEGAKARGGGAFPGPGADDGDVPRKQGYR
jgi:uncharacterized membrane protein